MVGDSPDRSEARQRARLLLESLSHGWTMAEIVVTPESDVERSLCDEVLGQHGYRYTWGDRSRTYENPGLVGSDASFAAELAEASGDFSAEQVTKVFPNSTEGNSRRPIAERIMREHGYEPEPPQTDEHGRVSVKFVSADARRRLREQAARDAAQKAFDAQLGPPSRLLGLARAAEHFECPKCGRWAEVMSAAAAYRGLVEHRLGMGFADWLRIRAAATPASPVRPAFLQREFGMDYDGAVALLEAAAQVGVLDAARGGATAAQPCCAQCYERRAEASEASARAPGAREPIAPQLRFRVLQRDGFRCRYCGRSARDGATLQLDHVVPVAAGGPTTEDNLITACTTCNVGKSDRPLLTE